MRKPRLGLARSTHIKVLPAYGRQLSMTIRGLWLRLLLAPCARGQKNRPGQDDDRHEYPGDDGAAYPVPPELALTLDTHRLALNEPALHSRGTK